MWTCGILSCIFCTSRSEEQEAASNAEPPAKILNSTDSETEATAKEKRGAQDGEKSK